MSPAVLYEMMPACPASVMARASSLEAFLRHHRRIAGLRVVLPWRRIGQVRALRQPLQQRPEFQLPEQRYDPVPVVIAHHGVVHFEADVQVRADLHHLLVVERLLVGLFQLLLDRGLPDVVQVLVDRLHGPELPHQVGRGLFADALDARNVVAAVTLQRLEVDHVLRLEAPPVDGALLVIGHGVALVRPEHEQLDPRPHQLHQVRVERDDVRLRAFLGGLHRDRTGNVVGLEPGLLVEGDVERLQHLPYPRHLRQQVCRRLAPGRLVGHIGFVPERLAGRIPGRADVCRLELVQHQQQRFRVAVRGEGQLAAPRHQRVRRVRHREERAKQDAVRIQDHQPGLLFSAHAAIIGAMPFGLAPEMAAGVRCSPWRPLHWSYSQLRE
ncbi:MAG: hypothetical protein U5Q44_15720 [Dehalococcoidia bacterium]|nr:hypothetical protein [Dehalococcoidia bacterium]